MMQIPSLITDFDFELPPELEAKEPPEARGLRRDDVRLMLSYISDDRIHHRRFVEIVDTLEAGDLLVINTSGTMPAALKVDRVDGLPLELHVSTRLANDLWVVEFRRDDGQHNQPFSDVDVDDLFILPSGASTRIVRPYHGHGHATRQRLWVAQFDLSESLPAYLQRHGFPIRYQYVQQAWPISYYQTVYATEMGSAEMPSAGRAFTTEIITRLAAKGVAIVPLILHAGVASLEHDEVPYAEYYRVPETTAQLLNHTRRQGGRVVAVGTTVVRALETVTDAYGTHAGEGWTERIITPEQPLLAVDAMLTGLHEPRASHLAMLEALAGRHHLHQTYQAALEEGYLWHEFGDLHLILP